MMWLAALVFYAMCLASGTVLVVTEHYGWAWIPFALAFFMNWENDEKKEKRE